MSQFTPRHHQQYDKENTPLRSRDPALSVDTSQGKNLTGSLRRKTSFLHVAEPGGEDVQLLKEQLARAIDERNVEVRLRKDAERQVAAYKEKMKAMTTKLTHTNAALQKETYGVPFLERRLEQAETALRRRECELADAHAEIAQHAARAGHAPAFADKYHAEMARSAALATRLADERAVSAALRAEAGDLRARLALADEQLAEADADFDRVRKLWRADTAADAQLRRQGAKGWRHVLRYELDVQAHLYALCTAQELERSGDVEAEYRAFAVQNAADGCDDSAAVAALKRERDDLDGLLMQTMRELKEARREAEAAKEETRAAKEDVKAAKEEVKAAKEDTNIAQSAVGLSRTLDILDLERQVFFAETERDLLLLERADAAASDGEPLRERLRECRKDASDLRLENFALRSDVQKLKSEVEMYEAGLDV